MTKQMIFDKPQAVATFPFEPIGNSTMGAAEVLIPQSITLTSNGTNVAALESVSLGSYSGQMYVYTFVTSLTDPPEPFEVKIGASAAATLDNLKDAVNLTGTPGDVWSEGTTVHPDIEATTNTDTTQVFAAKVSGYVGVLDVTETAPNLSFGGTTMSGAAGRIALASGTTLIVRNTGHKIAYLKLGGSTVTASTSDYPISPNSTEVLYRDPAHTHASAICAIGDTTTLSISTGYGTPIIAPSSEVTIGDITLDNVEISNDDGNPVPVSGTVALGAGTASIGSTKPSGLTARGYQQLTSLASAAALTVPANTTVALIQAESQSIRWRDDGSDPTTTVGMVLSAGESMFFTGSLSAFRAIEITASAKLNISYYG